MALIKCPECGKQVSNKAEACIHCGYKFENVLDLLGFVDRQRKVREEAFRRIEEYDPFPVKPVLPLIW